MTKTNYSKLVNKIEESIEYTNHNLILLQIDDWYLIRNDTPLSSANSYVYHRRCPQDISQSPFLHWRALKCRGCGVLPPEGVAGAYSLHNMEHIQQGDRDAD